MKSLFILILLSLVVGISAFIVFLLAGKKQQFDDIEGPKYISILKNRYFNSHILFLTLKNII